MYLHAQLFLFCFLEKWRNAQTYEKWSVLSIFGRCGPFPQDLEQIFVQIILYFIKIVKVCFIIASPMIFIVLWNLGRQGRCQTMETVQI